MPERVLANPLSGEEIRKSILDKISLALERDCFLSPNLAYDYYTAKVNISLTAHDCGRAAPVVVEVKDSQGQAPENEDALLEQADAELEIQAQPPNTVRVESGQDVPALARDAEGKPVIKGIKYSRKAAKVNG